MPDMFDAHPNFAVGTVSASPSPALSGTTLSLMPSQGERFAPNMPVTLCPPGVQPTDDTAEIAYVTEVDGDELTVLRAQEGTTAKAVLVGWSVVGAITAKTIEDVEAEVQTKAPASTLNAHISNVSNPHQVTKAQVGLANAENTSDLAKPISNPTQAALNAKVAKGELVVNVKDYGAVGDGVHDDTDAFDAAMAAGPYVIVPRPAVAYLVKYLSVPTKTTVIGQGRPQINIQRNGSLVISTLRTLSVIDNLYLNCLDTDLEWNRVGIENATNVVVRNCRIDGFRHNNVLPNAWGLFIDRSSYVRVENCVFDNNSQSDIAIVDQCSHIHITGCKGVSNFVINIEPNVSFVSSKILIENCKIQKAMTWDYSDVASPIDNAIFRDCVIDLYRYAGGNVVFDNTFITSFEAVSTDTVGNKGGKIANRGSFGYGRQLNDDPLFHKIVNSGADQSLGWTFFYSPSGNVLAYLSGTRGEYLSFNPNGLSTTVSIVRKFTVSPSSLYTVRALLSVYYPSSAGGTQQFAVEYYDASSNIIGTRKYIIVDKKNSASNSESEWDEKQFFFNTPANCTSIKLFVLNHDAGSVSAHKLNIQHLKLNQVLLNSRNTAPEEIESTIQSGPNTSALTPAGTQNQSLVGQKIYASNPGALGYMGWVCTVTGNPGTWKTFGALGP